MLNTKLVTRNRNCKHLIRVYRSDVFWERKKRIKRESGRRNTRAQAGCLCRVSGGCIQAFQSHKARKLRSCSLSFALPFFSSALLCLSLAAGFLSLLTRMLRSQTRSLKTRGVKMLNPIPICPQWLLFEESKLCGFFFFGFPCCGIATLAIILREHLAKFGYRSHISEESRKI